MRCIGVFSHPDKASASEAAAQARAQLAAAGVRPVTHGQPGWGEAQAVIALGGDGTFLRAQRLAAPLGVPVLCVNHGRLGFLAETESTQMNEAIARLIGGDFEIGERMMLSCAYPGGEEHALNDVVIHRGGSKHMMRFDIFIDGQRADTLAADGLTIASPMGSTAYALSAGGPVISPEMDCMLIVAICPHTLRARPMLIPPGASVSVRLTEIKGGGAVVSADGQTERLLSEGECVTVTRAAFSARFVKLGPIDFYARVRGKLAEWSR